MNVRAIALLVCLCAPVGVARAAADAAQGDAAQGDEEQTLVRLRVSSAPAQGTLVVDRGTTDGLAVGDTVVFMPRGGRRPRGRVSRVDERSAIVELLDPGVSLPPGTRGEVSIPTARLAPLPAAPPGEREPAGRTEPPPPAAPPGEPEAQGQPGASSGAVVDPAWKNGDEGWAPGMPLLAKVGAVRPEQRPTRISGRAYTIGDQTWTTDSDRSTTTLRSGAGLFVENPFGSGGELHVDGEVNYQDVNVPDADGETSSKLRVDRLSYATGGTRFSDRRWEAGRFLQYGLPEFGLLDGFEYGVRAADGHRFGASAGFMPEPDNDLSTADDFQLGAYYRWVADDSERLGAAAGYQKSWHNGNVDRDLLIGKFHYLPTQGWNYDTTVWVDVYTSGDDPKPFLQVTQAYANAGYLSRAGHGIDLTYTHLAFPQIDRHEFLPVENDQLADDHRERLALDSWIQASDDARMRAGVGVWADEEGSGADTEIGLDVEQMFFSGSRTGFTLFATDGAFTTVFGGRFRLGRELDHGRWDLSYEYSNNDQKGFTDDNDDLVQTWLRATRDFYTRSGWIVSVSADYRDWEDESSYSLGFYVQKNF